MSFGGKAISAFFWASGQQILVLVLNLVISIVLARILDPEEFGLIGMISIFIALGRVLMSGGLAASLIRTKNPSQVEFSTVFFSNIIFSTIIFIGLYFSAPWIAQFFERDELVKILRVYGLVLLIFPLSAIQFARLTKALDFKKTLTIKIPSIVLGGITGIYMAITGYGVWSLVGMYLAQAIADALQLWIKTGWRPSMTFSKSAFKEHISFGSKLTLSNVLNAIFQNIYNVAIGKIFTAQILGFFTRSQTLANLPVYNLQEVLDKVTYPLLSEIQEDHQKMKSTFRKVFFSVAMIITPILIISIIIAEPLFRFFLTEKWLPAVPYFQLICIAGIFVPLGKNNLNILKAKGRSGLMLRLNIIEKVFLLVGVFLIFPFGVYGLLYFQIGAFFISFLINAQYAGNFINYGIVAQLKDFFKVFLIALLAGFVAGGFYFFQRNSLHDLWLIIISLVLYFGMYVIAIKYIFPAIPKQFVELIKAKRSKP